MCLGAPSWVWLALKTREVLVPHAEDWVLGFYGHPYWHLHGHSQDQCCQHLADPTNLKAVQAFLGLRTSIADSLLGSPTCHSWFDSPTRTPIHKPQECLDCLEISWGQPDADSMVLAVSMEMPVGVTIKPKNSIFCVWNKHFSGFECKSYSWRRSKTHWTWIQWSSNESEKMRMSLR